MRFESKVTLQEMIASAKRELALRQRNYPHWVLKGRMDEATATHEIEAMAAIVRYLEKQNQGELL